MGEEGGVHVIGPRGIDGLPLENWAARFQLNFVLFSEVSISLLQFSLSPLYQEARGDASPIISPVHKWRLGPLGTTKMRSSQLFPAPLFDKLKVELSANRQALVY